MRKSLGCVSEDPYTKRVAALHEFVRDSGHKADNNFELFVEGEMHLLSVPEQEYIVNVYHKYRDSFQRQSIATKLNGFLQRSIVRQLGPSCQAKR